VYRVMVVKPGVGDYLEDLDVNGTIILKLILKNRMVRGHRLNWSG
jgi:hypothetical protein